MKSSIVRRWDWLSAALLFFMMQVATTRLVITEWTDFLLFAQALGTLGIILGLAIGYSQFKRRTVVFLALAYSIVLIPWQLSFAIHQDVLFSERLASVGGRLYFSLVQFFQREAVDDGLLFVAFISITIWIIGLVSGYWWNRHRNYLVAVLPGGIFTLVIQLYDQVATRRILLVGVYVLLALVLLGYLYYQKNHDAWRERRVFQMADSAFDVTRGMAITAAIFVFIAWTVPASKSGVNSAVKVWKTLTEPWREVQDWFSNAFEALDATRVQRSGDFYSNRLSLGVGNPLSESVIFSVEVPDLPEKPPRFYWRGYVYDFYQNNRWSIADSTEIEFSPANTELFLPDVREQQVAEFIFQTQISQSLLYTATQPVWVSRPGLVRYTPAGDGEQDLHAWHTKPSLLPGEQYHVVAALANPSIQQLQGAGTDYPQWVTDRYLQLPLDFSPRISDLAAQITQDLETPYEKADAVTKYLRSEIEYVNPLPEAPPAEEDSVEWLLFDSKQGFCNYYASAEVLMLRSLGVPARMAVGFSEGTADVDSEANTYIVRNLNAHAWPEVYFPDIGWVEFEPTVNQDPLVRPDIPEEETDDSTTALGTPSNPLGRDPNEAILEDKLLEDAGTDAGNVGLLGQSAINPIFYYLGATIALIILLWFVNRQYDVLEQIPVRLQNVYERNGGRAPDWLRNWARWAGLSSIERSFETINRSLRLLGEPPALYVTPAERADLLTTRLPVAAAAINTLIQQHEASLFTSDPGDVGHARRASLSIWLYTIQTRIQEFVNRGNRKG